MEHVRGAFATGLAEAALSVDTLGHPIVGRACRSVLDWSAGHEGLGVLERSRRAGRLTAVHADLDARKDRLEARWGRQTGPVLAEIVRAAVPAVITQLTVYAERSDKDAVRAAVRRGIQSQQGSEPWDRMLGLLDQAFAAAEAEGVVGARARLAAAKGEPIGDIAAAVRKFRSSATEAAQGPPAPGDPASLLSAQIDALAYGMSPELTEELNAATLRAIVEEAASDPNGWARLVLNHGIATRAVEASREVYRQDGLDWVDVLVSPGACDECEPLPSGNPYRLGDEPGIPLHIRCRCDISPPLTMVDAVAAAVEL